MMYLLDVNALVALGFSLHVFHLRVSRWIAEATPELATCSITELGFVRVLAQTTSYGVSLADAQKLLLRLKKSAAAVFISDHHDISRLPAWVKTANQLTDGHLLQLAKANTASLATLDRKIPGAFLIPEV
jgi:predicted nucleic acid-binding protein